MATWDAVDHYYSGQGVVLLAERDAQGKPTGFVPVGNVSDLKITVSTSVLEHKESHTGQRGAWCGNQGSCRYHHGRGHQCVPRQGSVAGAHQGQ
jgi:hypothetical protein